MNTHLHILHLRKGEPNCTLQFQVSKEIIYYLKGERFLFFCSVEDGPCPFVWQTLNYPYWRPVKAASINQDLEQNMKAMTTKYEM